MRNLRKLYLRCSKEESDMRKVIVPTLGHEEGDYEEILNGGDTTVVLDNS